MIVANPDEKTIKEDLPALIKEGHASIKVFMTYDLIKVDDEPLLDLMLTARRHRALICVHAENHGMIAWMSRKLLAEGKTAPKYHATSHPRASESEAITRLIEAAALVDQPIMIFHVSTAKGASIVGDARRQGLKVFAETCPQYLFLTAAENRLAQRKLEDVKADISDLDKRNDNAQRALRIEVAERNQLIPRSRRGGN
jgi:dihydropyrimidinase